MISITADNISRSESTQSPRASFPTMSNLLSWPTESKTFPHCFFVESKKLKKPSLPGALWRTFATRSTGRSSTSSSEDKLDESSFVCLETQVRPSLGNECQAPADEGWQGPRAPRRGCRPDCQVGQVIPLKGLDMCWWYVRTLWNISWDLKKCLIHLTCHTKYEWLEQFEDNTCVSSQGTFTILFFCS